MIGDYMEIEYTPNARKCQRSMLVACEIIERLVAVVNEHNKYDEHECPNGQPACGVCRLVTEAKAFVTAN